MPLDRVATNLGGVAARELPCDSVAGLDGRHLVGIDGVYFETVVLQVTHPRFAAASGRALVDGDDR